MKTLRPATLLVALVLAFAGAACGGGSDGGGSEEPVAEEPAVDVPEGQLSVADAKKEGGSGVTVYGTVYQRLEEYMLCNRLDESIYPPGCVDPTLEISNPDALKDVKLVEGVGQGAGLFWTAAPVSLTGDVQGDSFNVTGTG